MYDANHGASEYTYDTDAYLQGSEAVTKECMFNYPGYRFVGWNDKADGTGDWYYPDRDINNSIIMDSNKVVYAQWEEILPGSLIVSKTISGNAASSTQDFIFTVTLTTENGSPVSGIFEDAIFDINGNYSFTLKAGESKTLTSIPNGTHYVVSESDNDGYTVTVNNTSEATAVGIILEDKAVTAAFNNHKEDNSGEEVPTLSPAKVTITAEKILDGKTPIGSDFIFVLKDNQ